MSEEVSNLQTTAGINQQRLWGHLMKLREIGAGEHESEGITRLSFTPPEIEAKKYIIRLMEEVGLDVKMDAVGNVLGRLEGTNPELPVIMTGSHVDTVIQGGPFDGSLGVLGAIEAVRTMIEHSEQPKRTIEVVSFSDEEGTRFGAGYLGSKALTGQLKPGFLQLTDKEGFTYKEALLSAGFDPGRYIEAARSQEEIEAFVEMHIEQGRVLEEADVPVGIVTSIQGPLWLKVKIQGAADHAGATPMAIRKDASLAMAETMLAVERVAVTYEGVGTVGKLNVTPGGVNIIPGEAEFTIDLRHGSEEARSSMLRDLYAAFHSIESARGVSFVSEITKEEAPAVCSSEIQTVLDEAADECGIGSTPMPCGAGHDALIMSTVSKMGMILVRSENGISHNPKEWTTAEDCATGTNLLLRTLQKLAHGEMERDV
ncbi:Zn-dependent hydrolase [Salisediminibacterium beveridgei]|uniref:N-carbamoyl-L-amino acid hydrolase n=1 Tax=Salisediminibacterium beveridgei TaxID=632773 RepID=A0A1D7QYD8_9BACI|nr:Zn-dependent hydrolase [Salisediminibacterium beveridgei]AOM84025.1 N-carbamoyl-L-amino acid hydrolase [Salisediminibacterium beveridgei]